MAKAMWPGHVARSRRLYGHVITITALKESKGKPVAALFVHICREQIPVGAGNGAAKNKVLPIQFMLKLEGMARPW